MNQGITNLLTTGTNLHEETYPRIQRIGNRRKKKIIGRMSQNSSRIIFFNMWNDDKKLKKKTKLDLGE